MEALLVLGISAFAYVLQGRPLRKKKDKKAFVLFLILLLAGTALYLAVIFHLSIPRPTEVIAVLLKPVWRHIWLWVQGGNSI